MAVAPLEAGSVVGRRYRLERELTQQGGMGVVWTAVHLVTKRRVAIKLLRAGGQDDPASRARLLREARASCAVDHPNVLPVLDVIDADGAPALVMELLEGESLRERLERTGPIAPAETCALLAPVAEALAAAHAAGIVHRDIKPENIFLVGALDRAPGAKPTVKVLDFGIAKIVAPPTETAATNLTESGAMLGTPYYMSPEQAFGERDVGAAADAWALGIVLYECLSGTRPTQADNLGQVIKRITRDPIAAVEEHVAGVPAALAEIIARLLQRDVSAREVDMTRVARTLAACADARLDAVAHEAPPPKRRSRLMIAMALALAAAGSLAFALVRRTPPVARAEPPAATAPSTTALAPEPTATVSPTIAIASASASATPSARIAARTPPPLTPTAPTTPLPTPTSLPLPPSTDDAGSTGPGHVIIKPPF